jgi:hypothetical protein
VQPVWVLSVDLQTKTATFQSGLSDAAKSARGAFTEIKSGSGEMGREVSGNMMEARHGVILLGEEFGIHLPRGVTTFLASIGPVGAAMEAAFPFLAIAVGATILIEHLVKLHEEGEKVTEDQAKFAIATAKAFNLLDEQLLEAGIRTDELRNDHIGALKKQLELINLQSMDKLAAAFDEVAKRADVVFEDLKSHWYTFGIGATGAKHALDEFHTQYAALLEKGKDKEAADLLAGTKASAERILALQKEGAANSGTLLSAPKEGADVSKAMEAQIALKKAGVGWTDKEIAAQQEEIAAYDEMIGRAQRLADLKKADTDNAKSTTARTVSSEQSAGAREAVESQMRMGQQAIAGDRAMAEAQLAIRRASVQDRLAVDLDFAKREYDLQVAGNAQLIGALDKLSKDYPNQLKALHDKALELEQSYATQVTEITSKATVAQAAKGLAALEQSEREKIDATQKASAARLAVINQSIKAEEAAGLTDTNFYRELLTQRVQITEEMTETQAKLTQEAGREEAENTQKMGELMIAAEKQANALRDSSRRVSDQTRIDQETKIANEEYNLKAQELAKEIATLNKSGADYQNKLKELQDKETQLYQAHQNELTAITTKAEEERNARVLSADTRFTDQIASNLTAVLMRHETFAKMITSLGDQVVSGMIENAIKSMLADDMTKEKDAAAAARKAFNIGMSIGGPIGIVLGPVMGAAAFAAVMAFQGGTDAVPGVGTGDIVPAMLEPGEGVVPRGVMDQLGDLAKNGGLKGSNGNVYHVHVPIHMHASALDSDGVDTVFEKHATVIQKHFERSLRRLNH